MLCPHDNNLELSEVNMIMGVRISFLPVFIVGAVLLCYAAISISPIFSDCHENNPIRLVSDSLYDFQSSVFSIIHRVHDDALTFAPFLSSHSSQGTQIKAIYQFGDSISDTGNIIRENPRCDFANLPYGQTFFHKPTGRCSNGLLMIDYITNFLNLPFLDPYLNKDGNFTHGVNFAVAGATALNCSTLAKKGIAQCPTRSSLLVQLDWFKFHLDSVCSSASECKEKLGKALIMMGEIGGNDYNFAFFKKDPITKIYKMVPEVVQVIKKAIKEVINLGALRIVVPGNFPIGCMTVYLNMFKTNDRTMYDELQCLRHLNEFAKFHNDKLQEVIGEVQKDHPNVTIVYADYYVALREILRNATSLGFDTDIMQKPCCLNCGNTISACEHPYKHVNWDEMHLTQHAYQIMAKWLIKFNFQALSSAV